MIYETCIAVWAPLAQSWVLPLGFHRCHWPTCFFHCFLPLALPLITLGHWAAPSPSCLLKGVNGLLGKVWPSSLVTPQGPLYTWLSTLPCWVQNCPKAVSLHDGSRPQEPAGANCFPFTTSGRREHLPVTFTRERTVLFSRCSSSNISFMALWHRVNPPIQPLSLWSTPSAPVRSIPSNLQSWEALDPIRKETEKMNAGEATVHFRETLVLM